MMRLATAALLALAASAPAWADDPKPAKPTLQADAEKLEGKWKSPGKSALTWDVEFLVFRTDGKVVGQKIKLNISGNVEKTENGAAVVAAVSKNAEAPIDLKDDGKTRVMELGAVIAAMLNLPTAIAYKVDGDTLVLTVGEGDLKGEHKLERVKKDKEKDKE